MATAQQLLHHSAGGSSFKAVHSEKPIHGERGEAGSSPTSPPASRLRGRSGSITGTLPGLPAALVGVEASASSLSGAAADAHAGAPSEGGVLDVHSRDGVATADEPPPRPFDVYLWVDVHRAIDGGVRFYQSADGGGLLCDGVRGDGVLPPVYVRLVIECRDTPLSPLHVRLIERLYRQSARVEVHRYPPRSLCKALCSRQCARVTRHHMQRHATHTHMLAPPLGYPSAYPSAYPTSPTRVGLPVVGLPVVGLPVGLPVGHPLSAPTFCRQVTRMHGSLDDDGSGLWLRAWSFDAQGVPYEPTITVVGPAASLAAAMERTASLAATVSTDSAISLIRGPLYVDQSGRPLEAPGIDGHGGPAGVASLSGAKPPPSTGVAEGGVGAAVLGLSGACWALPDYRDKLLSGSEVADARTHARCMWRS